MNRKREKVMMKLYKIAIIIILLCNAFEIMVCAKEMEQPNRVCVGERIQDESGNQEKIVKINKDGSFVAESLEQKQTKHIFGCQHPKQYLKKIAKPNREMKIVGKAHCCFEYRRVTLNFCRKCGKKVTNYSAWQKVRNHKYSKLSKKCKVCKHKRKIP